MGFGWSLDRAFALKTEINSLEEILIPMLASQCRSFALLVLVWAAVLPFIVGAQAQDSQRRDEKAKEAAPVQTQPAAGQNVPPKTEETEYEEVMTPFGPQRRPRQRGATRPPATAAPVASPAASPAGAAPVQPPVAPAAQAAPQAPPQNTPAAATPAQQPQQPPVQSAAATGSTEGSAPIKFTLDHIDLQQFINIIGTELKINYVIDPAVKGVATIFSAGEFSREDLLPLLETVLKINGVAIARTGNFYQIVPAAKARQLPIPIRTEFSPAPGETLVTHILPMRFVSASDMAKVLTPYLSETAHLVAHEKGNILIITESPVQLKKLLDLIDIFDANVFENKRVQLYPIKNNRARSLLPDLEGVFAAYGLSSKDSAVRFIAVDRINAILAMSPNPNSFTEVQKWIDRLDKPVESMGVRNYIFKINNAEAKNIAGLLLKIYGREAARREPVTPEPTAPTPGAPGEPAKMKEENELAGYLQGEIKIVGDEINNALIIQCSPQDYETISETIRALDIVPRQVLIEAKIYEVNLTGALSMGVSAFLEQRAANQPPTTASFSATASGGRPAGLNISTFARIGATRDLVAFLNAQESRSRTRVLSSPTIIASDNIDARIQVGSEVPILTSQGLVPGSQQGGTNLFANTIQNRNTGVILNVTPRIGAGGWVTLKVTQEVSSPQAPDAGSAIQSPSISVRSVNTQVTIRDGETIAIGGIIAENKLLSKSRVPLLGDIPGLGLIFGNTSYTSTRTELIALITPRIIEDSETAADLTDELRSKLKNVKKILRLSDGSQN